MTANQKRTYITGLSAEEKEERRKDQVRQAQLRYRESHGLIKTRLSEEEKVQQQKEKARQRYLKRRDANKMTRGNAVPVSYTVDYQRNYHKGYYEQNRDKLLERAKTRYIKLHSCQNEENEEKV